MVMLMPKVPWNKIKIDKNWLGKAYLTDKLSISQIANIIGVNGGTIHRRLREYSIPTRSISEAKSLFNITEDKLCELYFKKEWSMFQIADYYGCNHVTIVNQFKKFGLISRGNLGLTPPIKITKEKLNHLYHNKNMSVKQIAKQLGRSLGGVERRMTKYEIKTRSLRNRKHWKYRKKSFNGCSDEKAYMIGFRLGDLNVYKTNQVVVVRGSTTKIAQVKLIEGLFKKYGGVKTTVAKRGTYEQCVYLNRSFDFLIPKQDKIEGWIKKCPKCFLAFFTGYFDAEGHISIKKKEKSVSFEIQSYDKTIIFNSHKNLVSLGILCPFPLLNKPAGYKNSDGRKNNGDLWRLGINSKQSVWQLSCWIKNFMRHKDKLKKLSKVKKSIKDRNFPGKGRKVINLSIPKLPNHLH